MIIYFDSLIWLINWLFTDYLLNWINILFGVIFHTTPFHLVYWPAGEMESAKISKWTNAHLFSSKNKWKTDNNVSIYLQSSSSSHISPSEHLTVSLNAFYNAIKLPSSGRIHHNSLRFDPFRNLPTPQHFQIPNTFILSSIHFTIQSFSNLATLVTCKFIIICYTIFYNSIYFNPFQIWQRWSLVKAN